MSKVLQLLLEIQILAEECDGWWLISSCCKALPIHLSIVALFGDVYAVPQGRLQWTSPQRHNRSSSVQNKHTELRLAAYIKIKKIMQDIIICYIVY